MTQSIAFPALVLTLLGAASPVSRQPVAHSAGRADGVVTVTFNVPVQLASLDPKFTKIHVVCLTAPNTSPLATAPEATADATITGGAFSGTIAVTTTITVQNTGEYWGYRCQFALIDSTTSKWWVDTPPAQLGSNANVGGSVYALAKPGSQVQLTQTGSFRVQ